MSLATVCVNGVCNCILPLNQNDFRPLALRHRSLAFVSALMVAVKVITLLALAVTPATAELSTITVARVVQLTNAERTKAGKAPLTVNAKLAAAAQKKGEDMLANDYFAHISPAGVTPWFWMQQQNYTYQVAGENLAIDFVEVEDVVAAWMASPSHHDNMLHGSYTETGVAVVTGEFQGGTSTIVVHMFGLPTGNPSSEAPASAGAKLDGTKPATAGTQQPAPSPTATPTPTPVPTTAPDTTPPRTPRIALQPGLSSLVAAKLPIFVDADPGSQVTIVVNDTEVANIAPEASVLELDLSRFADGVLKIAALARDAAGNASPLSESLQVTKDATGPAGARSLTAFVLGPQTDSPTVLASVKSAEVRDITIEQGQTQRSFPAGDAIAIALTDEATNFFLTDQLGNTSETVTVALLPHYTIEADTSALRPPARLNQISRWLISATLLLIIGLFVIAIGVKISIQRPAMIAHTSAVILLAFALLLI